MEGVPLFAAILFLAMAGEVTEKEASRQYPILKEELTEYYKLCAEQGLKLSFPRLGVVGQLDQGQVGILSPNLGSKKQPSQSQRLKILQVLNDREAIATLTVTQIFRTVVGSGAVGSINAARPVEKIEDSSITVLLRGFDLKDVVNDAPFEYDDSIIVDGTFEYTTQAGTTNKIAVLKPIKLPPAPKHPVMLGIGKRTWKDNTGNFSTDAAYGGYERGMVKLVLAKDGSEQEVPLNRLSDDDKEFVREKIREEKEIEDAKKREERRKRG